MVIFEDENQTTTFQEQKMIQLTQSLRNTAIAISSTLEFPDLLNQILQEISRVISFDSASITLLDGDSFQVVASRDFIYPDKVKLIKFPSQISPTILSPNLIALNTYKSIRVGNVPKEYPYFVHPPEEIILSWLCIPLYAKNVEVGTLNLDSHRFNHFTNDDERIGEIFAAQVSIALQNSKLYQNMKELANKDGLTRLHNRHYFFNFIEEEITRLKAEKNGFSIIMLDLDFFKSVNDIFGHHVGDSVLYQTAQLCLSCVRENDVIARFGGEEFIVLLRGTSIEDAKLVALRICDAIYNQTIQISENIIKITASLGVSAYVDGDSFETIFIRADDALQVAKNSGRNQVVVSCR